jgi:hypothetical protein
MPNEVLPRASPIPEYLHRGASTLVALCTVVGGFFAAGWWGVGTILLGTSVATGIALIRRRRIPDDHPLKLQPRRRDSSAYLTSGEDLHDVTAAAACLMLLERSRTGFWGYSYLYRLHVTGHTLPAARGSLTGTPFALTALATCTEEWGGEFEGWISTPIYSTLSSLFRGGQYLRNQRPSQVGLASEFEPPRHVAGALLCKVLLGRASKEDEETIQYLTRITTHEMAWDLAISARSLLTAAIDSRISRKARRSAAAYGEELLHRLVLRSVQAQSHADIWANAYGYGTRDESQWSTVWAVLPLLDAGQLSQDVGASLQAAIEKLLWSTQGFNSSEVTVFSRATRITALKSIIKSKRSECGLLLRDVQASLAEESRKFFSDRHSLLLAPVMDWEERDIGVEGFVGWAGICAAAGACGSLLPSRELGVARNLANQIAHSYQETDSKTGFENVRDLTERSRLLSAEYVDIMARAAVQVCSLRSHIEQELIGSPRS